MGRIRVLGDALIDRIAAGEVVERPASALKELIENAIDARATRIEIGLAGGGKQGIRVDDDGCGMDRDDALLALERHATSKLSQASDLAAIRSLGFRGEALASLAAVSVLRLSTADRDGTGTAVEARGGRIESVREVARARGTSVSVERLFFNVPARRKFLRADSTELAQAVRWATRFALGHPDIGLRLEHDGRELLHAPRSANRAQRIAAVLGPDSAERMLPFEFDRGGVRVAGLAGRPVDALPRRDGQYLFVNRRTVHDRLLGHALQEAYRNTLPRGRFPVVLLYLELDPAAVDVNVHPQKLEVRFREPGAVHDAVRDAVTAALGGTHGIPALAELRPGASAAAVAPRPEGAAQAPRTLAVAEALARYEARSRCEPGPPTPRSVDAPPGAAPTAGIERAAPARQRAPVPLAQFRESYIVAEDADGLVLVDQHAAHERVLFERFLAQAQRERVETQRLLFPTTFDLAPHEHTTFLAQHEELRRLGFEIEPFGGRTLRVDAVPAVAAEVDPEALVRELLDEAAHVRSAAADAEGLRLRLVTSAACQAAIKIHHALAPAAMRTLLDDLFRTASPTTCPHGRPIVFRLGLDEIERAFRRR